MGISWVGCFGYVHPGGGPRADPGYIDETMSLNRLGKTLVSPRRAEGGRCGEGILSVSVDLNEWQKMDGWINDHRHHIRLHMIDIGQTQMSTPTKQCKCISKAEINAGQNKRKKKRSVS